MPPIPVWPEQSAVKAFVVDFDKTVTAKHTRGAIFQLAMLDDKRILNNFADLEFLQAVVPIIAENATFCIATFADKEEESLLSGADLVRKYFDLAFDGDSQKYLKDKHIAAWNPENIDKDPRKVGKLEHLEKLRKTLRLKKSEMLLVDDSAKNCALARKAGYHVINVPEPTVETDDEGEITSVKGGFCWSTWDDFAVMDTSATGGCTLM
eukprot:m.82299 g.82299  ORF g.82299 m.82299 type:complete len:209 (+) comp12082_c0_seq2:127-753(+)